MYNINIISLKIPMILDFAVSEYKVQGTIFQIAVLNLQYNFKAEDKDLYKRFCSTYIQLLRLKTLNKVKLLQLITLENIRSKAYTKLQEKSLIIDDISNQTLLLQTYQSNQRYLK